MQQFLETVDDEIALLIVVYLIAGAHDALQIESQAIGRGIVQREDGFAKARDNARAIKPEPAGFADQAELHRVPVETRQLFQGVKIQRP